MQVPHTGCQCHVADAMTGIARPGAQKPYTVYADAAQDDVQGFYNLEWALRGVWRHTIPVCSPEVEICDFEVKFMAQEKAVSTTQSLTQLYFIGVGRFPRVSV